VKLLAWFIRPKPGKSPPAPVPQVSSTVPTPPVPSQPSVTMNVNLSGPEFDRAVEKALERIARQRGREARRSGSWPVSGGKPGLTPDSRS